MSKIVERVKSADWKRIGLGVLVLVLIGIGFAAGRYTLKPTLEEALDRNNRLARQDSVREVKIDSLRSAYQRLAEQYQGEEELVAELRSQNSELADSIEAQNRRLTRVVSARAELAERFDSLSTAVSEDSAEIHVDLEERHDYDRGYTSVEGRVSVSKDTPRVARGDLSVEARSEAVVTFSQDETGLSECTIGGTIPSLEVVPTRCLTNVEEPLDEHTRSGFLSELGIDSFGDGLVKGVIFGIGIFIGSR